MSERYDKPAKQREQPKSGAASEQDTPVNLNPSNTGAALSHAAKGSGDLAETSRTDGEPAVLSGARPIVVVSGPEEPRPRGSAYEDKVTFIALMTAAGWDVRTVGRRQGDRLDAAEDPVGRPGRVQDVADASVHFGADAELDISLIRSGRPVVYVRDLYATNAEPQLRRLFLDGKIGKTDETVKFVNTPQKAAAEVMSMHARLMRIAGGSLQAARANRRDLRPVIDLVPNDLLADHKAPRSPERKPQGIEQNTLEHGK